jgi:hypothetical protein
MDFSNYLFRCSSLYKLMTEPQSKEAKERGDLSATTKSYLREIFREEKYRRRNEFSSKYIEKGLAQEENAITLFCRVKKVYLTKNETRLNNKYITGEPDLFHGESITTCQEGWDTKCSWSLFTFPYEEDGLDKQYEWQNTGYMWLTGAKKWSTAYCLVNAMPDQVLNEKKSIWYKLGCPIFNISEFIKEAPGFDFHCTEWDYDININDRVLEFTTERNDANINKLIERIIKCREYLNQLAGVKEDQIAA